jgi:tartrate dehydrogenase/decarboxylase / D-malate dehydrogenase
VVRTYKIAAIPGDGIGREVVSAGLDVLHACAARDGTFALDVTPFDWAPRATRKPAL